jgi:hypothetical protein
MAMEDLPTSMLTQQAASKPRSGEELEAFGKQAASKYHAGISPTLNEAVVETVKQAGLSPEQVRRVIEFTNTAAFLQEFNKESSAHRVVHFRGGPADPSEILKDLNDGGGGSVFDPGTGDYNMPPPDLEKAAMVASERLGIEDQHLKQAFAVPESHLPFAEPYNEAMAAKDKLASIHDEAQSELSAEESRYFDICEALFREVKQASLGGTSLGHIVAAWQHVNDDPVFVKAAFQVLSPQLLENEVFLSKESMAESLTKTAGAGMANKEHPLVRTYEDFCGSLAKMAALRQISEEAAENADNLVLFLGELSKQADAAQMVGKGLSQIPKVWRRATEVASKASVPARRIAETVGKEISPGAGDVAGKVVGTAVKYAPHAAAGLAAEEVYQRARYNPAVQGAKNLVLSRIPYTHPYLVRQYDLQQRMF